MILCLCLFVLVVGTKWEQRRKNFLEVPFSFCSLCLKTKKKKNKKTMAHSHKPMSGDGYAPGYYSDNTIGCYNVIMNTKNLVVESLESVLKHHQYLPENEGEEEKKLITLADFGTADGGTSMPLFYDLCGHIHSLFSSPPPIQVFYEDQPINVWR